MQDRVRKGLETRGAKRTYNHAAPFQVRQSHQATDMWHAPWLNRGRQWDVGGLKFLGRGSKKLDKPLWIVDAQHSARY